jgi:hypothetical protein
MFAQEEISTGQKPLPPVSKEDYIILLLEELIRHNQKSEGAVERILAFEGALAIGGTAGDATVVSADFPHDAWVVYARPPAAQGTVTLRVWPGGTPPASGAIEIRNNVACRIKSTSNQLNIVNIGTEAAHYFAIAVSLAEVEFMSLV